jgi:hypothetical protein
MFITFRRLFRLLSSSSTRIPEENDSIENVVRLGFQEEMRPMKVPLSQKHKKTNP